MQDERAPGERPADDTQRMPGETQRMPESAADAPAPWAQAPARREEPPPAAPGRTGADGVVRRRGTGRPLALWAAPGGSAGLPAARVYPPPPYSPPGTAP